jgi:glycine dehydrogenase
VALTEMLTTIGVGSLDELIDQTVPAAIRLPQALNLPAPKSESLFLTDFRKLASQNKVFKSYIGTGYYDTITPNVILRNVLENPAWYTAYTPIRPKLPRDGSKHY